MRSAGVVVIAAIMVVLALSIFFLR